MTTHHISGSFGGQIYTATDEFNAAWEAIRDALPAGSKGDIVDLVDDDEIVAGSLRWENDEWTYDPRNADGIESPNGYFS